MSMTVTESVWSCPEAGGICVCWGKGHRLSKKAKVEGLFTRVKSKLLLSRAFSFSLFFSSFIFFWSKPLRDVSFKEWGF